MARLATPDVSGVYDGRKIVDGVLEANDLVRCPCLNARQGTAHMDLVNEYLHVQQIPGVRVRGLRLVADDAKLHTSARAAMRRQSCRARAGCHSVWQPVTSIAIRRANDIARRGRAPGWYEIVGGIRVVGSQIEFC